MPIALEDIERAFMDAVRKRRDAQAAVDRANRDAQAAADEVHALKILARNFFQHDLVEPPPGNLDEVASERGEAVRQAFAEASIADLIVAHFQRHPEAATPSEVSEAIRRDTGREIAAATITTTRGRNLNIFEMATDSPKRGAFRLLKDSPSKADEGRP